MITNRMQEYMSARSKSSLSRGRSKTIRYAVAVIFTVLALPAVLHATIIGFDPQANMVLLNVDNKQSAVSVPDEGVPFSYDFTANLTALGVTGEAVGGIRQAVSESSAGIGFPISTKLTVTGRPESGTTPLTVLFAGNSSGSLILNVTPSTILSAHVEFEIQGFVAEGDRLTIGVVGESRHDFQTFSASEVWAIDTPGPFSLEFHESSMPVPIQATSSQYGWLLGAVFRFEVERGLTARGSIPFSGGANCVVA
jgi:hypothetical protein